MAAARRVSWSGKKKKQKRSKEKHDYYGLLGLGNDRWLATEAQIQKGACSSRGFSRVQHTAAGRS